MHIRDFQHIDVVRCEAAFHPIDTWAPTDWACALAGEVGEACNAVNKFKRGDGSVEAVADELGDVIAYAALLAERLGIDLEEATIRKFNAVSERKGYHIRIPSDT